MSRRSLEERQRILKDTHTGAFAVISAIFMILGLVCVIIAPIFGQLMQLALSRRREYLADATSVEFTRNPDGLISALEKLDNDIDILED